MTIEEKKETGQWKRCYNCLHKNKCPCEYSLFDCITYNHRKRDPKVEHYDWRMNWLDQKEIEGM